MKFKTEQELIKYTSTIIGKTFRELDKMKLSANKKAINDKGILGKIVETGFYGYKINNHSKADFADLGIELKVSGFERLKSGIPSAKERISLGQIDYNSIINEEFETSNLRSKCNKLLIIWYEYRKGILKYDFEIKYFQLYDMKTDESIIKNDFDFIKKKVQMGKSSELSEGDTVILGAAPKGQKNNIANKRAFVLKNSFFKGVLRNHIMGLADTKSVEYLTPESYIWDKLKPYKGKSQLEILCIIKGEELVKAHPSVGKTISNNLIGTDKQLIETHEVFNKTNYSIRNIPIRGDGYPIEKANFNSFEVDEFQTTWDDSEWKIFFEETTIIYVGYLGVSYDGKNLDHGQRILDRIYKVTFTPQEVESFSKTYDLIKRAIEEDNEELLPTATRFKDLNLVIAPKGIKGDRYSDFLRGKKSACFMFNKYFLQRKFSEAISLQ